MYLLLKLFHYNLFNYSFLIYVVQFINKEILFLLLMVIRLSPVGNRISVFDLVNNKSETLPFENRRNIEWIGLTPNGNLLLSIMKVNIIIIYKNLIFFSLFYI